MAGVVDWLEALPHGPEFRFVDSVDELDPGKTGKGTYKLKGKEDFLKGHFPKNPIFPGVLMAESIAQLCGIVAQSDPDAPLLGEIRLTAVRNVKILGTIAPGESVDITCNIIARMGNLVQAGGEIRTPDGELICRATLTLSGKGT